MLFVIFLFITKTPEDNTMRCKKCNKNAVFEKPNYCGNHFIEYFETKVKETIKKFSLLNKNDRVVVAVSGGKDSTTILYLLHKFGYNVVALAIDEGIQGYRPKTLKDLKEFCKNNKIKLKIVTFKDNFNKTLDQSIKTKQYEDAPCTICGTFRRYLLNKYAKGFDKIATGHNLDDEAQSIIMNLTKGHVNLLTRLGPISTIKTGFTQRIKPLYFCTEKEVRIYSLLKDFSITFVECPYAHNSYRSKIRDLLNNYENKNPGTKINIVNYFLKIKNKIKTNPINMCFCILCDQPSLTQICKACQIKKEINN
ncbi:MAG: TIGR00269 family protein [Candidatus Woesearchaeota archaeon]